MNNLNKIISRIEEDARHDIDIVAKEAEAECDRIQKEYKRKADSVYASVCKEGQEKAQFRLARLESTSKTESSKRILSEKQKLISEAFEYTAAKLLNLPAEKYIEFTSQLISAAADGNEEVVFSPSDREKYGTAVVERANALLCSGGAMGKLTLSEETRRIRGGAILKRGKIELNCSLDALIDGSRDELCGEVSKILFD